MKTIITTICLLLLGNGITQNMSADFDVSMSSPYQVVDAGDKQYFPLTDGNTLMVKTRGAKVTIQLFSTADMKELERKEYEDFPKYNKVQDILQLNDRIFYIYEAYNKKEKTFTAYAREINTKTAQFIDNRELLTTSRPAVNFPEALLSSAGNLNFFNLYGKKFKIQQSFDKTTVLLTYRLKPLIKSNAKNYDELGFYVFDNSMNKKWGEEVKMPHTEKQMSNLAYTVGKNGNAYMLTQLREDKKFELITIGQDGSLESKTLDINGDLVFQEFKLLEDKDGNIVSIGYYANGYDFKVSWNGNTSLEFNTNGIYFFTMSPEGEILSTNDYEFELDDIKLYLNERQRNKLDKREDKGNAGIQDLKIQELLVQDDGSILIIGEQIWVKEELYGISEQTVFHYSNIMVTKMNAQGEVLWNRKLAKNQAGVPSGFQFEPFYTGQMSIRYFNNEDKHYIFFVDNPKNAGISEKEVPAAHKDGLGGYISAYAINDADGSFERHTIADLTDIDGVKAHQFKVTRIYQSDPKTFLMEAYIKGKKDATVQMKLK